MCRWLNGLMKLGAKRHLQFEDAFDVTPDDDAAILTDRLLGWVGE